MQKRAFLVVLLVAFIGMHRAAVTAAQQAAATIDALVKAGRAALEAGRVDEAEASANRACSQAPANRDAVDLKIAVALKKQRQDVALATYDDYVLVTRRSDVGLLAPIARAELRRLSGDRASDEALVVSALDRLAAEKDAAALQALKAMASGTSSSAPPAALSPLVSLTRAGDEHASRALAAALRSAPGDEKREIIRLMKDAQLRSQAPTLIPLLSDSEPGVRAAAAAALGALDWTDAVKALRPLLEDPAPIVRPFAAASLKRLGDTSVDAQVAAMLRSDVPQMRLIAAEAYVHSKSSQWVEQIKPLLGEPSEMIRLRAVELLAVGDPPTARLTLVKMLDSLNPATRGEAGRILEDTKVGDAATARRLLSDQSAWVRLHGAGLVLALEGARKPS